MQAVFKQLSGAGKDELDDSDVAFLRRFGPTVTQLVEAFQTEDDKLRRQVPFSQVCCTEKELGVKAQSVTRAMRDARAVAQTAATPIDSPFKPGPAGFDLTTIGLVVGGTIVAAVVLPQLFRGRR